MIMLLATFIFSFSCSKRESGGHEEFDIYLPLTEQPRNPTLWGVTKYSNLKFREVPEEKSRVLKYITRGSVLELIKQTPQTASFDGKIDYWYYAKFNGLYGWIFGSYIDIFITKYEAEKKCEEILFSTLEKN